MDKLRPHATDPGYPTTDQDDPRLNTKGRLTGELPQQATGEDSRGPHVPVDNEVYQYPTSRDAHNLARTAAETTLETPEAPGFWTKKKIAIAAGVAGLALTAGTLLGIVSKSDKPAGVSPLDEEPVAGAPVDPGAGEKAAPTLENVTIEAYGYQVGGETLNGSAALDAKYGVNGEVLDPTQVVETTFDSLNAWVNSGATEEEKKASESFTATSGTTGIDGLMEDIYNPAFTNLLTTTPDAALDPNRPAGIGYAGLNGPEGFIANATEWHTSHTKHGIETTFVPRSEIEIIGSPDDPYMAVHDGNRNHIDVQIDQVAIVQPGELDGQPVDVTTQTWNFSLVRVADTENGGTDWKVVSFNSQG